MDTVSYLTINNETREIADEILRSKISSLDSQIAELDENGTISSDQLPDLISDSNSGPIYSVYGEGHAEQDNTVIGTNLLDPSTLHIVKNDTVAYIEQRLSDRLVSVAGQSYILSTNDSNLYCWLVLTTDNNELITNTSPVKGGPVTITASQSGLRVTPWFAYSDTRSPEDDYSAFLYSIAMTDGDVQLEIGDTTDADYMGVRPYRGNPSFLSPRKIQTVQGRNLAYLEQGTFGSSSNLDSANIDNSINLISSTKRVRTNAIPIEPNITYTVIHSSWQIKNIVVINIRGRVIGTGYTLDDNNQITFIEPDAAGVYFACSHANDTETCQPGDYPFQVAASSTPLPYVPYGHIGLDVKTPCIEKRGYTISNSDNSGWQEVEDENWSIFSIEIQEGTSFLCQWTAPQLESTNASITRVFAYDKNNSFISMLILSRTEGEKSFSFIAPKGTAFIKISRRSDLPIPTITTTTPIPLPSKGCAAALPDGTKDILTVDSVGKWQWINKTGYADITLVNWDTIDEIDTTNSVTRYKIVQNDMDTFLPNCLKNNTQNILTSYFKAGLAEVTSTFSPGYAAILESDGFVMTIPYPEYLYQDWASVMIPIWDSPYPFEIVYPVIAPTVEYGYIDLPDISNNSIVNIPELSEANIKYFIDKTQKIISHISKERKRAEDYNIQFANNYYEGRNIIDIPEIAKEVAYYGTPWEFLHARISQLDFSGLRVGDYMEVPSDAYGIRQFVIADFDPYYQYGSTDPMNHHICFVDRSAVYLPTNDHSSGKGSYGNLKWNLTSTNQGTQNVTAPYLASNLCEWALYFSESFPTTFTDYIIPRWENLETRYSSSDNALTASTGSFWENLDLMWALSEVEVCGNTVWGTPGYSIGASKQLSYFHNNNKSLLCKAIGPQGLSSEKYVGWWLRTVSDSSSSKVCRVAAQGGITTGVPSATKPVTYPRLAFLLG